MKAFGEFNKKTGISEIQWLSLNLPEITVGELRKLPRPDGYSLPNTYSAAVEARAGKIFVEGFSDGSSTLVKTKAISEALERLVMSAYAAQTGIPDTSNGWACHYALDQAVQNAFYELIERDVVLTAWENGHPFYMIPEKLWPTSVREWNLAHCGALEYSHLKICLSQAENGAATSAFLFNDRGNCVAAHSSKYDLNEAIVSAFMECLRAAHSAILLEHFPEVIQLHQGNTEMAYSPGSHSVAYAYSVSFPSEIKFLAITVADVESRWREHQKMQQDLDISAAEILAFKILDRVVVRFRHQDFRDIYWGLSTKRKSELKNINPHIVG